MSAPARGLLIWAYLEQEQTHRTAPTRKRIKIEIKTMIHNLDITKILFFDIETVPASKHHDELIDVWTDLWKIKAQNILRKPKEEMTDEDAANIYDRAGIYAEFGKIICISVGFITHDKEAGTYKARLKSFANDDEKKLLTDFSKLMNDSYSKFDEKSQRFEKYLCGHNIKEFDVPYISRRLLINQMPLPKMFDIAGKKPWEISHLIDTMELWKFGDYKNATSVKLLAAAFGFPSPKDDIDGSDVHRVYYLENGLERISGYCEKDVLAVMHLLMKYKLMPEKLEV